MIEVRCFNFHACHPNIDSCTTCKKKSIITTPKPITIWSRLHVQAYWTLSQQIMVWVYMIGGADQRDFEDLSVQPVRPKPLGLARAGEEREIS